MPRLYRVIVPVPDMEAADAFYGRVLALEGVDLALDEVVGRPGLRQDLFGDLEVHHVSSRTLVYDGSATAVKRGGPCRDSIA
jgi:catechol 2,3-dioxygenase-like lactoylglutathione lyase family enzyme